MRWFPMIFGVTIAFAFIGALFFQGRKVKWLVLRHVHGWPGMQRALDALGQVWAKRAVRRLPDDPADW
jgi:hypothetical protein